MKLLVVDDNDDIRILLKRNLELAGHEVVLATSGEDALRVLPTSGAQAIISDILMPHGSGTWLAEQIRKTGNVIPIVLISASGDSARAEALKSGANEFIKKPLDIDFLEAALDRLVT